MFLEDYGISASYLKEGYLKEFTLLNQPIPYLPPAFSIGLEFDSKLITLSSIALVSDGIFVFRSSLWSAKDNLITSSQDSIKADPDDLRPQIIHTLSPLIAQYKDALNPRFISHFEQLQNTLHSN